MRKRVLIAEDFSDTRRFMKLVLEQNGYDVDEASDGFEAVKKAVSHPPDLILMDIAMPVMDGIQATQAIRLHYDLREVPIVALTGYGDFYEDRARDVGCNQIIQKPISVNDLAPLVEKFMN